MPILMIDKLKAVQREIALRKNVYPSLVKKKKMTAEEAAREIEIMQAIADDYALAQGVAQATLFDTEGD